MALRSLSSWMLWMLLTGAMLAGVGWSAPDSSLLCPVAKHSYGGASVSVQVSQK